MNECHLDVSPVNNSHSDYGYEFLISANFLLNTTCDFREYLGPQMRQNGAVNDIVVIIPRHTKSGGVLRYTLRTLSVRPSVVRPSVSASFPCSNFSTFLPICFKLCIGIGIGQEWHGIASGIISFRNNRVKALDLCPKCIFGQYLRN